MDIPQPILESLPTPCLVVDLAAVDRNIARAIRLTEDGARLRPHFKAHKTSRLLRRQLDAGGCAGATVQTAGEALVLARAGVHDILVAAPVVDPAALAELAEAAALAHCSVVVDSVEHVRLLTGLAQASGVGFDVLIELDVGIARCGLPFGDRALLAVAHATSAAAGLRFTGIQAYEGHVVHRDDPAVRDTLVQQVGAQIRAEVARLEAGGHHCEVISGAGTGTGEESVRHRVHTELQLGSYVLMDAAYGRIGLPYEQAFWCVTRCVSRREPSAAVLNAGLKALAVDSGLPQPAQVGLRSLALSDEHTRIAVAPGVRLDIGDVVLLEPSHVDPTVNLHDVLFVWDAGTGQVERWPVDARRLLGP